MQEPFLGVVLAIGPADVEPPRRHLEIDRRHRHRAGRIDDDRRRALGDVGMELEADPAARVARQRDAQQAVIEDLLDIRGVEDRHGGGGEGRLALMDDGRGPPAGVIPGDRQHAAMDRGARRVAVVEGVARAVDPRPLAVPQREYPVITRPVEQIDLLAAPDGGGGELLVDAGLEMDVVPLQEALGLPQRMVVAPERRAAIARDEPRRVEAGGNIAPALHHRQTHQGLGRGDEHAAGLKGVFVVKRQIKQGHVRCPGLKSQILARIRPARQSARGGFSPAPPGRRRRRSGPRR